MGIMEKQMESLIIRGPTLGFPLQYGALYKFLHFGNSNLGKLPYRA